MYEIMRAKWTSSVGTSLYLMLKFWTRFYRTWWIRFNIALEVGFTEVLGVAVIPYSALIRDFLSSWTINYDPWPYVISVGLGYLVNHIFSTKFAVDITLLLSYCVILNHPVTGSIMVTDFRFKYYLFPVLSMTQGPIISTQSLFRGISSVSLAGSLPYFIIDCVVCWQVSQLITSFWTSTNVEESSPPLYPFLDGGYTCSTNVIRNFGLLIE